LTARAGSPVALPVSASRTAIVGMPPAKFMSVLT
jgi:hypothetical protein